MNKLQIFSVSLAALSIAGCQSLPMELGLQDRQKASAPDVSSYFAQRLNDGRRHLRANRPGAAITAFRQASYHPDYAGAAFNGLAISYDRMGRSDLAHKFFQAAIRAAPEDPRFARNAVRFEVQMLARNENASSIRFAGAGHGAGVTQRADEPRLVAEIVDLTDEVPQRMKRISTNEVRLTARDIWGPRLASAYTLPAAVVHVGRAPSDERRASSASLRPVRLAFGDRQDPDHNMSRVTGAVSVRASGELLPRGSATYPITIALNPS